ncbi:MAG: tRNA (N6-threonylcarbamoyladenosine(37)-N6)-methyltransferase TrmO, partial [Neisseria mucosa]|nr:tRNA (N6-threonylcarbamoyladenosine(37)-N6)-methyltransferase TrmO [Neisseria mucosa]
MSYSITPIATVHSPYKQKFGIARQPGLVPAAEICIELTPEFT